PASCGGVHRDRGGAVTRDVPTRFEDRLLAELLPLVGAMESAGGPLAGLPGPRWRPRPARSGSRPVVRVAAVLGLLLLVLGGAVVGVALWPRQLARPAYAVQEQADGSLLVTVNDVGDPHGLRDTLAAHGVPAGVLLVEPAARCPEPVTGVPAPGAIQGAPDHRNVLAIWPDRLPPGTTAVLGLLG